MISSKRTWCGGTKTLLWSPTRSVMICHFRNLPNLPDVLRRRGQLRESGSKHGPFMARPDQGFTDTQGLQWSYCDLSYILDYVVRPTLWRVEVGPTAVENTGNVVDTSVCFAKWLIIASHAEKQKAGLGNKEDILVLTMQQSFLHTLSWQWLPPCDILRHLLS